MPQLDFMTAIDGIPSFEGLRRRATPVRFEDAPLYVVTLAISSEVRSAGRAAIGRAAAAGEGQLRSRSRATPKAQLDALKK